MEYADISALLSVQVKGYLQSHASRTKENKGRLLFSLHLDLRNAEMLNIMIGVSIV